MLTHIEGGFAYLGMTKTGSTSVENAIRPLCQIMFTRDHRVTHMPGHHFEKYIRPFLDDMGMTGIDSVCQLRNPLDWLESWWRYRAKPSDWQPEISTKGIGFDQFAAEYIAGEPRPYLADLWRPQAFIFSEDGRRCVDLIFRFEDMALFEKFLSQRVGTRISIKKHNASPLRWTRMGKATRAALEDHFKPELDLWESGTAQTADIRVRR